MIVDREPQPRPQPQPTREVPRSLNLDRLFLYQRGQLSWDQMTGARGGPRRQGHRLIFWSWLAVIIDALVLISVSSFFVLAFALIVRSPIGEVLRSALPLGTMGLFFLSFVACSWLYMVTTRVLFGFSIGEGACDLRLGEPTQRARRAYPFKVIARATLILMTGLVVLPALSLIFGKDLAGRISGLRLVSLK